MAKSKPATDRQIKFIEKLHKEGQISDSDFENIMKTYDEMHFTSKDATDFLNSIHESHPEAVPYIERRQRKKTESGGKDLDEADLSSPTKTTPGEKEGVSDTPEAPKWTVDELANSIGVLVRPAGARSGGFWTLLPLTSSEMSDIAGRLADKVKERERDLVREVASGATVYVKLEVAGIERSGLASDIGWFPYEGTTLEEANLVALATRKLSAEQRESVAFEISEHAELSSAVGIAYTAYHSDLVPYSVYDGEEVAILGSDAAPLDKLAATLIPVHLRDGGPYSELSDGAWRGLRRGHAQELVDKGEVVPGLFGFYTPDENVRIADMLAEERTSIKSELRAIYQEGFDAEAARWEQIAGMAPDPFTRAQVKAMAATSRLDPIIDDTALAAARAMLGIEEGIREGRYQPNDTAGFVAEAASRPRSSDIPPASRHPALGR